MIEEATGELVVLRTEHSLFEIPMQYWGFVPGGIGIAMLVASLV
jgi:hypothetical protein